MGVPATKAVVPSISRMLLLECGNECVEIYSFGLLDRQATGNATD
jgi:hypothetical protein